jgi:hypothetical protein
VATSLPNGRRLRPSDSPFWNDKRFTCRGQSVFINGLTIQSRCYILVAISEEGYDERHNIAKQYNSLASKANHQDRLTKGHFHADNNSPKPTYSRQSPPATDACLGTPSTTRCKIMILGVNVSLDLLISAIIGRYYMVTEKSQKRTAP